MISVVAKSLSVWGFLVAVMVVASIRPCLCAGGHVVRTQTEESGGQCHKTHSNGAHKNALPGCCGVCDSVLWQSRLSISAPVDFGTSLFKVYLPAESARLQLLVPVRNITSGPPGLLTLSRHLRPGSIFSLDCALLV